MKTTKMWAIVIIASCLILCPAKFGQQVALGTENYIIKFGEVGLVPAWARDSVIYEDPVTHNIGIGTTSPHHYLHVFDNSAPAVVKIEGTSDGTNSGILELADSTSGDIWHITNRTENNQNLEFHVMDKSIPGWRGPHLTIQKDGNVGIGTTNPWAKLEIGSSGDLLLKASENDVGDIIFRDSTHFQKGRIWTAVQAGLGGLHLSSSDNQPDLTIDDSGGVGIGTMSPAPDARLTIASSGARNILLIGYHDGAEVVTIGRGLDYSETFPTSQDGITPGTVMVIDPVNKGSLTTSTQAYDKKVAGIVAGAKGLDSGVRLGPREGTADHPVALAGRVYCNVDTQYGDIEPGDLLTTSVTPGYAMVVKDFSKAQGAILGKAMEGLSGGGKRQILVLVTLQ